MSRRVGMKLDRGVETFESCEGGHGHAFTEPTICFHGTPAAGWHALSVCLDHGLPVAELRRTWRILDRHEPSGASWSITFYRKPG